MAKKVEAGKTYIGVIEDNKDPKKLGRVKVRVIDVFDDMKLEDIPWAFPWKDLGGNQFNVPDNGKIVTVVFDKGNSNSPEFISSDHYNINLEKKVSGLSDTDYSSMKSLHFDHKTQIYVNDGEGLKLDHKFNVINIKEDSIDINLKDNFSKVHIGTAKSDQRAILGDNFMNWMDNLMDVLTGSGGGAFIGNLGAPVIPSPALISVIQAYQNLRDPKFLSKNVYLVDNEKVEKLDRIADGTLGDEWQSTVEENKITSKEPVEYKAKEGTTDATFEQPPADAPVGTTQSTISNGATASPPVIEEKEDVKIIKALLSMKGYQLYEDVNRLNIIGIRNQCIEYGDKYSGTFKDKLYITWKKEDNTWDVKSYNFSTVPGVFFTVTDNWLKSKNIINKSSTHWSKSLLGKKWTMKSYATVAWEQDKDPKFKNGLPVLVPAQYVDVYYISEYKGEKAMKVTNGASQLVWRDRATKGSPADLEIFKPTNFDNPETITPNQFLDNGIKIHRGYPGGVSVGNWSEGSQTIQNATSLNEFFNYAEKHKELYGNKFTYTLSTKKDWEKASDMVKQESLSAPLASTQSSTEVQTNNSSPLQPTTDTSQNLSTASELKEKNKSEVVDVLGDGTLLVEIFVSKSIENGKITTDDIKSLEQESFQMKITKQPSPGLYEFSKVDITHSTPSDKGSGDQVVSKLEPEMISYNIGEINTIYEYSKNNNPLLYGIYKIKFDVTLNNKQLSDGSPDKTKSISKSIEFSIEKGSNSSTSTQQPRRIYKYYLSVINPTTPEAKAINGSITFESSYNETTKENLLTPTGYVSGFPGGQSIGPVKGVASSVTEDDILARDFISDLEDQIAKQIPNGQFIKLTIVDRS